MKIVWNTILWTFLILVAFLTLFPVVITFLGSFKTNAELTAGATFLPSDWQFENYLEAWVHANFSTYTLNSLFVASVTTIGTLLVASMAAYVVNRMEFIGKKLYVGLKRLRCL